MDIKLKLPDADAPGYIALQIEIAHWRKRVQKYLVLQANPPEIGSDQYAAFQDESETFWAEFAAFAKRFIVEPADLDTAQIQKLLSLKMVNQIFDVISGKHFLEAQVPLAIPPSSSTG